MAAPKKAEKATKIKKKEWYSLIAPKLFRNVPLGQTLITEVKLALGKTITANLMNLINDVKKQNINIIFEVDKIEGKNAMTRVIGFKLVPTSIKRLTRRRSQKIELSFIAMTSDNQRVRVKPIIFARSATKSSVNRTLHKNIIDTIKKAIVKMTFEQLVTDLINHNFQRTLSQKLKRTYPIRIAEVKYMKIEKEKKPGEEDKVEVVVETPAEEPKKEEPKEKKEEKPKEPKKEEKKPEVKEEKKPEAKEPEPKKEAPKEESTDKKEEKK